MEVVMAKKNFMFIFHGGYNEGLSPQEAQKNMEQWFAWVEKLQKKGIYKAGEPLEKGGKVLSFRNGKIAIDGPYAETKELVAGYFLLEADSLDEAVEIAKEYPDFPYGGRVEVREVMPLPTR
jgi:hypothetical protein